MGNAIRIVRSRDAGFFSNIHTVLAAAAMCEQDHRQLVVSFTTGYYLDRPGDNWWEYYFDRTSNADPISVSPADAHDDATYGEWGFSGRAQLLSESKRLLDKYVRVLPYITKSVDKFAEAIEPFLAVHLRGTDKSEEGVPRFQKDQLKTSVDAALSEIGDVPIFLATDEWFYVETMKDLYGNRLHFREAVRAVDTTPIHRHLKFNSRRLGEEALIDCLILSRSKLLLRSQSNLSDCACRWNPDLPFRILA